MDLTPSAEEMRALGYAVVDMIVDHEHGLRDKPATRHASPDDLRRLLDQPLPREGSSPEAVLRTVREQILACAMYPPHPRFFGYIPGPGGFLGAMADTLVSGFNLWAASWLEASAPTAIEMVTIEWLRKLLGLPDGAGGLFTSGGALANLTALVLARDARAGDRFDECVVYASDRAHCTIERAARVLGLRPDQQRAVPADVPGRIDVAALSAAVRADREAGRLPLAVVANAGTTSTGAIDDLPSVADLCAAEGLWMHVDAAFGGAVCFSPGHAGLLAGIERADSITLDPHKWLFQPFGIGCLMVRDERALDRSFALGDDYLSELKTKTGEVNLFERGIEMTRPFRALKLWMTLNLVGADALGEAIDRGIAHAERAERLFGEQPGWRIVTPASMGVVSFRFEPERTRPAQRDELNRAIVREITRDGFALITAAEIDGAVALRMCTINQRTTDDDVEQAVRKMAEIAEKPAN